MGGLTSLASTAIQVLGAVDSYRGNTGGSAYNQAKAESDLMLRNAAEQAALQKEQVRVNAEQAETERRAALRRAMARQRAQFGASGIATGDSASAQAVLLGMFEESDEERQRRGQLDALKTGAIEQGFAQQNRINTLQLTQLKERDRLKNIGGRLSAVQNIGSALFS